MFASEVNLLQSVILVKVCEGNLASHRHVVGKKKRNLIAFSYSGEYSPLTLCKSTRVGL